MMKKRGKSLAVPAILFGIGMICIAAAGKVQESLKKQRIRNVENGLVEFQVGPKGIEPTQKKAALAERMGFYKVPGVSIAVIDGNQIEWAKGYGVLKAGATPPVTPDSLFQAASTSKLLTAAAALHFVEKGKLALDEDVNKFLKSWKLPENDFTREKKVTLRLLLSHRSGLPMTNFDHDEKVGIPTLVDVLKGQSPARNKPAMVGFVPGSQWQYSNIGYDVVQLLLEDVTGKPFARIAKETIFNPLGMSSSTFNYPLPPKLRVKEAMPHLESGAAGDPSMPPTALAHGGLMTNPSDLAKFIIELMFAYQGKSDRLLSQAMARQLFTKEVDLDPGVFGGFAAAQGLGVFLVGQDKNFSFAHPGSNLPGTSCWLEGCPEVGKGFIVMANGAGGDLLALEIRSAVIKEYRWPGNPRLP
jgi:CubicO group peptidase (beta-lactamase class C family)